MLFYSKIELVVSGDYCRKIFLTKGQCVIIIIGGYSGELQNWCLLKVKSLLSVVKRKTEKFEILPIRWIVERTFAWMNNYRRLSKHYEHTCKSAKAQVEIAMTRLMLNRLIKC